MIDGLLVGINFLDILQLGSGICQQVVVDFQPESPCNVEIVLDHQIVNLGDRPGGSLHSLTGHHGGLGEELGSRIDGLGNGVIQSLTAAEELALVAAAQLK